MKRFVSALLTLCLVISTLPVMAMASKGYTYESNALRAYRDFIMSGAYTTVDYSSIDRAPYGVWGSEEKAFALHDMDDDGTPELFIYNGDTSQICALDYIFTYTNARIQLLGACGLYPRYFPGTEYSGIFSTFHSEGAGSGSYVTKQGNSLNSEIIYSYDNFDSTAGQLKQRTNNSQLYRLFVLADGSPFGGEPLYHASLAEINSMGWDGFVAKALPDASGGIGDTDLHSINLPFYSGIGGKTNYISVDWDWSLFGGPALTSKAYETYDNRLAVTGLALSAAAEKSQEDTKALLTSVLGFTDYDYKNYDSSADQHPAVNFACQELVVNGQTQYIFAVVVRGTITGDDIWTDISSMWGGFETAADHLYGQLGSFMGSTSLPDSDVPIGGGGRVKFFVTGHSLGGAVANIMAKKLSGVYGAENVFAYTFASPKVISGDDKAGSGNIYNVMNKEDWVPAVPPNLEGRNGLSIWFSRRDNTAIEKNFSELTNGKSLNSLMAPSMLFWESGAQLLYPHYVETYMSFLLSLSDDASLVNRFAGGASGGISGGGVWCPVDLEIYVETDRGSKLVGRIQDNVVDESVTTGVVLRVDGDKKYFYFPIEGNYTIKMTGTGTDTMTYFVQKMDLESGEPIQGTGTMFQNISLTPGKQFSSNVQAAQGTVTGVGTKDVKLYVLDGDNKPEREVLADGNGTEVPVGQNPMPPMTFADVAQGAYYYDAVLWAVENGITNGTSATHFSPNQTCTRAQTVTFLWRAAGSPAPKSTTNPFTDVAPGAYYYDAVLWAVENGITNGTSATTFSPDVTVTRGQTVTFLYRAAKAQAVEGTNPFVDVAAGEYYADPVQWAVAQGITNGTSTTTFGPSEGCTRGQIVTFLYRAN